MLRVTGLVEEGAPVVGAAHRLDDEDDPARDLDRGAERARALLRALLDVELDVLLRLEVDAHVAQRRLEGGQHLLLRELRIPLRRSERADHVPALRLVQADAGPRAEEPVGRLLEDLLRRVEERAALVGEVVEPEPEAAVEVGVVRRLELLHALADEVDALDVERVEVLLGQLDSDAVDLLPLVAVRLVRHRRPQHAERNRLAVHVGLEARLELGGLLCLLAGQLAQIPLGGEAPELADPAVSVRRPAEGLRLLQLGQLGVALVDRRQLELVLEPRVVEIELLVEVGDEAVCPVAEAVQVGLREWGGCARQSRRRITTCARFP